MCSHDMSGMNRRTAQWDFRRNRLLALKNYSLLKLSSYCIHRNSIHQNFFQGECKKVLDKATYYRRWDFKEYWFGQN